MVETAIGTVEVIKIAGAAVKIAGPHPTGAIAAKETERALPKAKEGRTLRQAKAKAPAILQRQTAVLAQLASGVKQQS